MTGRRRPRVLLVSGNAPPVLDGVGDSTARLAEELARQRPEWGWFWLSRRPGRFDRPVVTEGGVTRLRPAHTWARRGQAAASAWAWALGPDVTHVHEQIHSFHETGAACRVARASRGVVVATLHEYHTERPSVVYTDALVRLARVVIANDPRNAARCRERTGRAPDFLWWTGTTVRALDPSRRVPATPGLAVTFGFPSGLKMMSLLHEALRLVRGSYPGLTWRVVGPFEPAADTSHAALLRNLEPDRGWVELTGGVQGESRLRAALADAAVMPLPFADGASVRRTTLQAAWALGVPVVTTPPPHETDAIVDGENCLLVREPTPPAWADALRRVLSDPDLASRLSSGGLRTADRFSWPRLAAAHLAVYDSLLDAGPHAPYNRPGSA